MRFVAEAWDGLAKFKAKVSPVTTAAITQFHGLEIAPDPFIRIEVGGIAGPALQMNALGSSLSEKVTEVGTAMSRQAIPDKQQFAGEMTEQMLEEMHEIRTFEGPFLRQGEQPAIGGDGADQRQVIAGEGNWQQGSAAHWSIATRQRRQQIKSRFIDKPYRSAFLDGLFSSSGQRSACQRSIAASSRWLARLTGFWLLHRSAWSKRPPCTVEYRPPNSRSLRVATRAGVQMSPRKPTCSAPFSNSAGNRPSCSSFSRAAGPPPRRVYNPSSPPASARLTPWLTAPSLSPSASAMSFCFHPLPFSSHAHQRLISRQLCRLLLGFSLIPPLYLISPLFFTKSCFAQ